MKAQHIAVVSMLTLSLMALNAAAHCGSCPGDHPSGKAVTKSCPADCTKPCCAGEAVGNSEGSSCARKSCGPRKWSWKGHAGKRCSGNACAVQPSAKSEGSKPAHEAEITTEGLRALLATRTPLVLLDARSGKYDDGKRIPGARSLNAQSSSEEVASVVPDKNALVVTYCSNLKCPASASLAAHLRELGYKNIIEYPSGIQGWVEAGNEVVEAN